MLFELLQQQVQGGNLSRISKQLGADEQSTGTAITAALPLLLGALARNSSDPSGADSLSQALEKDHDGSILDNLGDLLGQGSSSGAGILRHVFGGRQASVESAISRSSGLDSGSASQLMTMLAPLVMGALGKAKRQQHLDARGVSELLQSEKRTVQSQSPAASLMSLLDADGDGSVIDEIGGFVGRFFK